MNTNQDRVESWKDLCIEDRNGEKWLSVDDFPKYLVSNHGRVKRIFNTRDRVRRQRFDGKAKRGNRKYNGRLCVTLSKNNKVKHCSVHRLVLLAFKPRCHPLQQVVDHISIKQNVEGRPTNNHLSNLRWVTRSLNNLNQHFKKGYCKHTQHRTLKDGTKRKYTSFYVRVRLNCTVKFSKNFKTAEEARKSYLAAQKKIFDEEYQKLLDIIEIEGVD